MTRPGDVMRQTLDESWYTGPLPVGLREDMRAVLSEREDMMELLVDVAEFLDNYADAEGNSAADWKPNQAMRLLNRVEDIEAKR
jgi:hypothetical protein